MFKKEHGDIIRDMIRNGFLNSKYSLQEKTKIICSILDIFNCDDHDKQLFASL